MAKFTVAGEEPGLHYVLRAGPPRGRWAAARRPAALVRGLRCSGLSGAEVLCLRF